MTDSGRTTDLYIEMLSLTTEQLAIIECLFDVEFYNDETEDFVFAERTYH